VAGAVGGAAGAEFVAGAGVGPPPKEVPAAGASVVVVAAAAGAPGAGVLPKEKPPVAWAGVGAAGP